MQIVPLTRSSTIRQAGQLPMSPPPGQAGQTPPMHEFMHQASNICTHTNTLSGQIIMISERIIICPLSVYYIY